MSVLIIYLGLKLSGYNFREYLDGECPVITANKVSLEKDHFLLISQGKREVAEFSRSSGLKKRGSFLLGEDTSKQEFYLRFFILSCSRTEEDNKVATSYMWLSDKLQ